MMPTFPSTSLEIDGLDISPLTGDDAPALVAAAAGFTREGTARNAGFTDVGRTDLDIWSRIPADASSEH